MEKFWEALDTGLNYKFEMVVLSFFWIVNVILNLSNEDEIRVNDTLLALITHVLAFKVLFIGKVGPGFDAIAPLQHVELDLLLLRPPQMFTLGYQPASLLGEWRESE